MQFASIADRDAAFQVLLDRGAAVRVADSGAGAALVVIGSASLLDGNYGAIQVSADAGVSVSAVTQPARGSLVRAAGSGEGLVFEPARAGIAVAIVDSGLQPHADLPPGRIRAFKDFVGGSLTPVDGCGHGTHVAGIIAGSGLSSDGLYAGIAPAVDVVALRVLGDDCSGNASDVIDALEWIARNHARYRIRVVNLSLGHAVREPIATDPLVQAVERLSRQGVMVITAAGNRGINPATNRPGYGGVGVPCNAPSSICVGSLDTSASPQMEDDRVSDSSARGPARFDLLAKPDLVAPGVNIVSIAAPGSHLFNAYPESRVAVSIGDSQYFVLSGTSMASPSVAAAAALLVQQNQALTANTVKLALQFTARLMPRADVLTQGAGALNVPGALIMADAINPNVRIGTHWIRHRITAANFDAFGQSIPWSQRIVYGDRFVRPRYAQLHLWQWEDDVAWGNAEDDTIVWGTSDSRHTDYDNIVWGNGLLRGGWAAEVIEGFWDGSLAWGSITRDTADNIVWGNVQKK
jgi:subtilisin family serine protease